MGDEAADYGFDAPHVPALLGAVAVLAILLGVAEVATGSPIGAIWLIAGAAMATQSGLYVRTTRTGKFAAWEKILDRLDLRGDEQVLDIGCGRGAVLTAVAKRVPNGTVTGIDVWRSVDQSGNAPEVTLVNAAAEGVADRVELHTGTMVKLPFPEGRFDLVVSSLAIHNLRARSDRVAAIDEAVRVLSPGGRLVITDIKATKLYAQRLTELGLLDVERRNLGPDFWFGGPWVAATLVTATKPSQGPR